MNAAEIYLSKLSGSLSFNPLGAHSSDLDVSTAVHLAAPDGADKIMVQAITQNVRFRLDGAVPTANTGFLLTAGDPPLIIPLDGNGIWVIEAAATASLQYQFGR